MKIKIAIVMMLALTSISTASWSCDNPDPVCASHCPHSKVPSSDQMACLEACCSV